MIVDEKYFSVSTASPFSLLVKTTKIKIDIELIIRKLTLKFTVCS
jgi:hypothetical protein